MRSFLNKTLWIKYKFLIYIIIFVVIPQYIVLFSIYIIG